MTGLDKIEFAKDRILAALDTSRDIKIDDCVVMGMDDLPIGNMQVMINYVVVPKTEDKSAHKTQ